MRIEEDFSIESQDHGKPITLYIVEWITEDFGVEARQQRRLPVPDQDPPPH